MNKPTPGPWKVAKDCGDTNTLCIYDPMGVKLAWVFGSNVPGTEGEANAAFIVEACNSYAALSAEIIHLRLELIAKCSIK